jgi:hypothetical protein
MLAKGKAAELKCGSMQLPLDYFPLWPFRAGDVVSEEIQQVSWERQSAGCLSEITALTMQHAVCQCVCSDHHHHALSHHSQYSLLPNLNNSLGLFAACFPSMTPF